MSGTGVDLASKTLKELDQMVENHEKTAGGRSHPRYALLLEARAKLSQEGKLLSIERSMDHLREKAIEGVCTSYGKLAAASGIEWSRARTQMNGTRGHLERLLDICHARGLPMLTAICVDKDGVEKGELSETALAGFANGARHLGYEFTDEAEFHRQQRDACFAWGRSQRAAAD